MSRACDTSVEPAASDARDESTERTPLGKADAIGSCAASDGSEDYCGGPTDEGNCWCDDLCEGYGDCCSDKADVCDGGDPIAFCQADDDCGTGYCDHSECLSNCPDGMICPAVCWGQCGEPPPPPPGSCEGSCGGQADGCWCDDLCSNYGDCCDDYEAVCLGPDCDAMVAAFQAETAEIRSCDAAAECGQVLTGTSCGCTRNWVARSDADISMWQTLRDDALAAGCELPGMISTCDCPVANGFACNDGTCSYNYL